MYRHQRSHRPPSYQPASSRETIYFSQDQHLDLYEYTLAAGKSLMNSGLVPEKYEFESAPPKRRAKQLGISALALYITRDPIFDKPIIEDGHVSTEDPKTGKDILLHYKGREDLWEIGPQTAPARNQIATDDVAELLTLHNPEDTNILQGLADTVNFSSQDILWSIKSYLGQNRVAPKREQALYRYSLPSKSVLPSGRNDATAQYRHVRQGKKIYQELSTSSAHLMPTIDDTEPSIGMITTYLVESPETEQSGSSVIMFSQAMPLEHLEAFTYHESRQTANHFERIKHSSRFLQELADQNPLNQEQP